MRPEAKKALATIWRLVLRRAGASDRRPQSSGIRRYALSLRGALDVLGVGTQPSAPIADPLEAHPGRLKAIRAVVLTVEEVAAKFKYGGNVDHDHRKAVIERLRERAGPGDSAAAHNERRLSTGC